MAGQAPQAFVFNTYGITDNLAFVWVHERGVKKANGNPLPNGRIGLTADKTQCRGSFSSDMQTYLTERDPWFQCLENFRHSLGHRIPLYIPPFSIRPADEARYRELEASKNEALFKRWDLTSYEKFRAEQDSLRIFRPWMRHSFSERSPVVPFHVQSLADFATIEELIGKIFHELAQVR